MSMVQNPNSFNGARTIATLMLVQMALGLLLNFYFLKPVLRYDGSTPAGEITLILGCATIVALIVSSINIAFGLLLPQDKIRKHWSTIAFLLVFATAGLTLCAYEYTQLANSVSFLTSTYAADPNTEFLRATLASGRNEAHFFSIFISSCSLVIFYILLLRAELIHKWLSYFAVVAATLQLVSVGHTFFQASIPNILQLPLVITQLIVPVYLFVSGFKQAASAVVKQPEVVT